MRDPCAPPLLRRDLLRTSCLGFGGLALASLLGRESAAQALAPHHAARAKRMIFLFMHGGPSQVDTFDYKPLLQRDDGKPFPGEKPRIQFANTGDLLASPWKFAQHGQSGQWVSELFPNVARHVDKLCFVKSLHGTNEAHGGALLALHTGSDTFVRPSMGSWIVYGLGSENENLPGFVTICPTLGHGGVNNWSSAFLPGRYQGTPIGHAGIAAREAKLMHLARSDARMDLERAELDFLATLNEAHRQGREYDEALAARIASFELAYRMQSEAPEALDVERESPATRTLYGFDDPATENFGRQCLMARRLVERGVRFVQCTHSYKWDQHANLKADHAKNAREVDLPIAGLLEDLHARGLLRDTLVLWGGEFGRSPCAQDGNGRDHNPHGFTVWMAGAGLKAGHSHGATDDYGWYAVEGKVHVHDLHATVLDLFGLDHERLTFRHAGRDFRLTDVAGRVVRELYA
jgi:hypothetical protein